jgi:hypothetical protein
MSHDNTLEDLKNLRLTVGNAVNATATMAQGQEDPVGYFAENLNTVIGAVIDAQATQLAYAGLGATPVTAAQVPQAAPVAVPTAAPNVVQFPTSVAVQAPQPYIAPTAPAPAPIPGASNGADPGTEANWMAFFTAWNAGQVAPSFQGARDGQWFDNRAGKSPKAPDFKVKGRDQGLPAVWLNDKKNPAWVATAVQQAGLA